MKALKAIALVAAGALGTLGVLLVLAERYEQVSTYAHRYEGGAWNID